MLKLAVQETLVPGVGLEAKFENALSAGYDAIELRAAPGEQFRTRLDELTSAVEAGVVISSACMDLSPSYLGSFDAEGRQAARTAIKVVLDVLGEAVPGVGLVVPNGCAVFSTYLPPFAPPVERATAQAWLEEGLRDLAAHAGSRGVRLFLEPLNRYEDWVVNTIGQAATIVADIANPNLGVCVDSYHATLEEANLAEAIVAAGMAVQHVQLGDSNRLEPGRGHLDWNAMAGALSRIDYRGWLALECFLSGPGPGPITNAAKTLRAANGEHQEMERTA